MALTEEQQTRMAENKARALSLIASKKRKAEDDELSLQSSSSSSTTSSSSSSSRQGGSRKPSKSATTIQSNVQHKAKSKLAHHGGGFVPNESQIEDKAITLMNEREENVLKIESVIKTHNLTYMNNNTEDIIDAADDDSDSSSSDDGEERQQTMNQTHALKHYCLTPLHLKHLPYKLKPNPRNASLAPMKIYQTKDLMKKAYAKWGGKEGWREERGKRGEKKFLRAREEVRVSGVLD